MIFFVISIMSFIWRTGTIDDANPKPITSRDALAPRIIITCFFSLGFVYLILIAVTFRRYGTTVDRAWRSRVVAWTHHKFNNNDNYINPSHGFQGYYHPSSSKPVLQHPSTSILHSSQHLRNTSLPTQPMVPSSPSRAFTDKEKPRGRSTSIKPISAPVATKNSHRHPPASRKRLLIKPTKLLGLCADDPSSTTIPSKDMLVACQMTKDDWERLSSVRHHFMIGMAGVSLTIFCRKFILLGTPINYPRYKVFSTTGTKHFSMNAVLKLYYVKKSAYLGLNTPYIIFLPRTHYRRLMIDMTLFRRT